MPAMLATTLALAGVLAWECFGSLTESASPLPARPAPERVDDSTQQPEALRDHTEVEADVYAAILLARPLFSAGRRPLAAAVVDAPSPSKPTPPRLTGTLVSGGGRQAFFAPAVAAGKTFVAGEGGQVGTFVVSAIAAGEVTVATPDGETRVLHPQANPAAREATTVAVAVPVRAPASSVLDLLRSIPSDGPKSPTPGNAR